MNPIEILYCWQALILAVIVSLLTQGIKNVIPFIGEPKSAKGKLFLKRVVLVSIPPILGFIIASIFPLRPEVLIEYISTHVSTNKFQAAMIFGAWGAAVGQFADHGFSKAKKFFEDKNAIASDNS